MSVYFVVVISASGGGGGGGGGGFAGKLAWVLQYQRYLGTGLSLHQAFFLPYSEVSFKIQF